MSNAEVIARFTSHISLLSCITLGVDGDAGIWVNEATRYGQMVTGPGDYKLGFWTVSFQCSDTFEFACGDYESLSTMEELEIFIKITHWFLEQEYNSDEWYKKHYPTFEDYLNGANFIIREEYEDLMNRWLGHSYCMIKRGVEIHPYYWKTVPDWLKVKLQEEGVERHPYRKEN